jgi:membrane dipeptidase
MIVDAHLDLAYNAVLRGRDVRRPASEQPFVDNETATVGLPDLRKGHVDLICATIFCSPFSYKEVGYRNGDEAYQQAIDQLQWYQDCIRDGLMKFVRTSSDLPRSTGNLPVPSPAHGQVARATGQPLHAILLMEGADALRNEADVKFFHDAGMRIVGLAWKKTRAAGGTGQPGPLSDEGRTLVKALDRYGIIHDTSHLAEEAFWQLMDLTAGPIIATHSNARALVPTDRQLSDDMIKAIVTRGGVIGINFYDKFTMLPKDYGTRKAQMSDIVQHIKYMCDLIGNANHVAIGTDLDGGIGREHVPPVIETIADLHKLGDALSAAGFNDRDVQNILSQNWLNFFASALPSS